MFIIRCSKCGFEIKEEKQIRLYGGVDVALKIVSIKGSPVEIRRKTAGIFNDNSIPCPKCKSTDSWSWI